MLFPQSSLQFSPLSSEVEDNNQANQAISDMPKLTNLVISKPNQMLSWETTMMIAMKISANKILPKVMTLLLTTSPMTKLMTI